MVLVSVFFLLSSKTNGPSFSAGQSMISIFFKKMAEIVRSYNLKFSHSLFSFLEVNCPDLSYLAGEVIPTHPSGSHSSPMISDFFVGFRLVYYCFTDSFFLSTNDCVIEVHLLGCSST